MEHRGATSADNISGDGAGVMTAIPWRLFSDICDPTTTLNADGTPACAVGMVFLPREASKLSEAVKMVENIATLSGMKVAGWRQVPIDDSVLGSLSADFVPTIRQLVLTADSFKTRADFEKALYTLRREIQGYFRVAAADGDTPSYVCSLSSKTIVYKGMLRSCDLGLFYRDLTDPAFETPFAIYHRRFSTNTVPKWFLAQPMRLLAHNGEINTLLGNINWVRSRETAGHQEVSKVRGPLVDVGRSDSANLDSILENYVNNGCTPEEALMILVPEAYGSQPRLAVEPKVRAFYEYYESLQEAWDGPALLVFSDGETVGATLDRNGLRPARYMVTSDANGKETVHVMSEVGVTKALDQFSDAQRKDGNFLTKIFNKQGPSLIEAGRLGPGEMLAVNLKDGKLYLNDELKTRVAEKHDYESWVRETTSSLKHQPFVAEMSTYKERYIPLLKENTPEETVAAEPPAPYASLLDGDKDVDDQRLLAMQTVMGWGTEDVEVQLNAMASTGMEATYCMGDDAPLAALSALPHTLYDYFKQRFAQVTNPPIDPLREGAVMSVAMYLGARTSPVARDTHLKRVKIESPVMNAEEVRVLSTMPGISYTKLSTLYPITEALSQGGLERALDSLCNAAIAAVENGATVIDLSDEDSPEKPYTEFAYIPPLMAVAAVHHRLIETGLRTSASIIATTGQAWSTHHFACLIGYGASAVVPYGAYAAIVNWHGQKRNQLAMARGDLPKISAEQAMANFRKSIDKGLLKILSKMGISLLSSYHGAQIFEALGLSDAMVNSIFKGTPSRVSGLNYDDIAAENVEFHRKAFGDDLFAGMVSKVESGPNKLFNYGFLNFLKSGEYHHNNQPLIKTLHSAIRNHDLDMYRLYEESVTSRPPTTLRDMLKFNQGDRDPVPLDEVESVESIMRRFVTGGMSLGALSREAHETLAIAMNRIGGRSNSGEGGEDPRRRSPITDVNDDGTSSTFSYLKGLKNGDHPGSKIKQVASGRFGVTPAYLMSGDQLEIKIAQGAKPGEGGQLPGNKIDTYIATLRKSKPGVTLISPPPHHDIYSIEDLAQLIYDLHQINPAALVSVKLVSEVGIGTVASGVAKAGADVIQVAGHDGGTGASPASSIKFAGSPWELGLIETHATLLKNGLRDRVLLRVDGGLKSGWDVVMAAAMGAEEFGFGTIALIAEGCIMARICHTNKCPVGVTTQNEALRKRFPGTPDNVVTFFGYVAQEVRSILASLGFRSLDEVIGQPGLLKSRVGEVPLKKTSSFDVSYVLEALDCIPKIQGEGCLVYDRSWLKHGPAFSNGYTFDDSVLEDASVKSAIDNHGTATVSRQIKNIDRSALARVSGVLASKYGDDGFKGSLRFELTGGAGQSFCAFIGKGMDVTLRGYANDYVCKGMASGRVVVSPPTEDDEAAKKFKKGMSASKHSVVGNTVLYGATGGSLMVRGRGGERFAVRNSGALGVIEGLGDHGCEYMTGGTIVCLGSVGRNFGAGMTGGLAFIIDDEAWLDGEAGVVPDHLSFNRLANAETVSIMKADSEYRSLLYIYLTQYHLCRGVRAFLEETLRAHLEATGSSRAERVLSDLDGALARCWMVVPASEKSNPILAKESTSASVETSV